MDTELFKEWFQAFSQPGIALHIENIYGENSHHKIESCYKGLTRSLKDYLAIDKRIKNSIPSTKALLKLMNVTIVDYQSAILALL